MTLLDGEAIKALIAEVAAELDDQVERTIIVVGGSLLAWHDLRDSTLDVDSIRRLDDALRHAVATVAARHGLAADWLNDRAAPWAPATLEVGKCEVLFRSGQVASARFAAARHVPHETQPWRPGGLGRHAIDLAACARGVRVGARGDGCVLCGVSDRGSWSRPTSRRPCRRRAREGRIRPPADMRSDGGDGIVACSNDLDVSAKYQSGEHRAVSARPASIGPCGHHPSWITPFRQIPTQTDTSVSQIWEQEAGSSNLPTPTTSNEDVGARPRRPRSYSRYR